MDDDTSCLYPRCDRQSVGLYGLKLCQRHVIATMQGALRLIQDSGHTEADLEIQAQAALWRLDRDRRDRRRDLRWGQVAAKLQGTDAPEEQRPREWVYFLAFADRIKIGYSSNLGMRLEAIPYDEVLAVIPGTRDDERRLHERFHHLRIVREWFQADPELLAHIAELKVQHPDVPIADLLPRRRRSRRPKVTVRQVAAS